MRESHIQDQRQKINLTQFFKILYS